MPRKCEIYAVGNTVVYLRGHPPLPPAPWIVHDQSIERPLAPAEIPMLRDAARKNVAERYVTKRKAKALALGPGGQMFFYFNQDSPEEAARRALESCGVTAGVPCKVVVLDDTFIVPVPTSLNVTGLFHAANNPSVALEAREDLVRSLAQAPTGWNAVAVGTSGGPGLAVKLVSERDAVNDALGDCVKRDSDCHVIAIGPFTVGPK